MMKIPKHWRVPVSTRGFTLVELMIVVAVVAVVLVLAAPSFRQLIDIQKLRGTTAQLVTDIQFARSEAVSRQEPVAITYKPNVPGMSCYAIHTCGGLLPAACAQRCQCQNAAGARCAAPALEIRTVQVPTESRVKLTPQPPSPDVAATYFALFSPITGGMQPSAYDPVASVPYNPSFGLDTWVSIAPHATSAPTLSTVISLSGRPSVCSPGGRVSGVPACY